MFGRATIRLGIGPHSSSLNVYTRFLFVSRFLRFLTFFYFGERFFIYGSNPHYVQEFLHGIGTEEGASLNTGK